jgi:NNP family nitrate/nitrite transporter-like MFS transporter
LLSGQFPQVDAQQAIWLGPLCGALARPLGGWLSDRLGGARVTLWAFVAMTLGVTVMLWALPGVGAGAGSGAQGSAAALLAAAFVLFAATGVGNGSTYRMIPLIFLRERRASAASSPDAQDQARRDAGKEAAAALGFASAIAAYGGFFIPKTVGSSIALTGAPTAALLIFIAFYLSCIGITWWFYSRRFAPMPC